MTPIPILKKVIVLYSVQLSLPIYIYIYTLTSTRACVRAPIACKIESTTFCGKHDLQFYHTFSSLTKHITTKKESFSHNNNIFYTIIESL